MKAFEESDRLNYPLNADSIIVEIGSFEGWFAGELWNRFGAQMYLHEPIAAFRVKCEERFKGNDKVTVSPHALGSSDYFTHFGIRGDMTGEFCGEENGTEKVHVMDVLRRFQMIAPGGIDLLAVNCEGGEYGILDRLIETGWINKVRNLSVQFHAVGPDYLQRHARIIEQLKQTHDHVYGSPFVWDGFKLKE